MAGAESSSSFKLQNILSGLTSKWTIPYRWWIRCNAAAIWNMSSSTLSGSSLRKETVTSPPLLSNWELVVVADRWDWRVALGEVGDGATMGLWGGVQEGGGGNVAERRSVRISSTTATWGDGDRLLVGEVLVGWCWFRTWLIGGVMLVSILLPSISTPPLPPRALS